MNGQVEGKQGGLVGLSLPGPAMARCTTWWLSGFRVGEPGCGHQEPAGRSLGTQGSVCACVTASEPGRQPALMKPGWKAMAPTQRGGHHPDTSPSSSCLRHPGLCSPPTKPANNADLLGLLRPRFYHASPRDLSLSWHACSLPTQALCSQKPVLCPTPLSQAAYSMSSQPSSLIYL